MDGAPAEHGLRRHQVPEPVEAERQRIGRPDGVVGEVRGASVPPVWLMLGQLAAGSAGVMSVWVKSLPLYSKGCPVALARA